MAEEVIPIGLSLDTSHLLQGTQRAQQALAQMGTATDALLAKLRTAEQTAASMARALTPLDTILQRTAQAEAQTSTAATQLATALQRATAATQASTQAQASHQQALAANTQALTRHHHAAQQASAGVSSFGSAIGLATGVLGAFGVALSARAVVDFGKSVVETGAKMEQLRRSFTAIAGSSTLGRQGFAFVTETANRLGLGIEGLASSYRSLTAATRGTELSGQDTQALFTALTQASRTYGMSSEQTGRALLAFQQIASKGKVTMEELRQQLGEALPGAGQIAARAFGVTTQDFEKMVEKGITATEFWRKFTIRLAKETPEALAQAGQGFKHLGNEIVHWKDRMAQEGILKFFDDLFSKAGKAMEASRRAVDAGKNATERSATAAMGGDDITKLSSENQRRLLELSALVVQAENDQAQKAGRGLSSVLPLMRQQQVELAARIKLEERLNQLRKDRAAFDHEPDEEFEIRARARAKQEVDEKERDAQATKDKFAEIDARTKGYVDAQTKASPWRKLVEPIAERYGVDPRLVEAVIKQESNDNPRAVSKAGARGLMQLMPGTGRDMGLPAGMEFDPAANIEAGVRYLAKQLQDFNGNIEHALAAYNAGPGAVRQSLREHGGIPRIKETQDYVPAVLARMPQDEDRFADDAARALKTASEFEKDLLAQRQARWKDLDIFGLMLAPEQEAALKEQAKDQHERIRAFAKDLDILGLDLSPEQEKRQKALAQASSALERYQEQLGLSGGEHITSETRQVTRAEKDLEALWGTDKQAEAEVIVNRFRLNAKEAEPEFRQLMRLSEGFADSFLSTIERATQGGIKSFKEFAISVAMDMQRLMTQEFLRPLLTGAMKQGIDWLGVALGATQTVLGATSQVSAGVGSPTGVNPMLMKAGGGPVFSNTPYVVGERGAEVFVPSQSGRILSHSDSIAAVQSNGSSGAAARASGGPAYSDTPYVVGERGAEAFVPAQNGRILSHGDAMAAVGGGSGKGSTVVNMGGIHIHGVQDFNSFQRSQGQINAGILQAIQRAQRAA